MAERHREDRLPGYTHLQRAQPVSLGHHLLAWFWMLRRDVTAPMPPRGAARVPCRWLRGARRTELGHRSVPWPRRARLRPVVENSIDAVSNRDFALDYLGAASVCVEPLPPADRHVGVRIEAADGHPAAARVRVVARDGRYLPPLGHRDEVDPALYEDLGADIVLDGRPYAYVPATFEVAIPADGAVLEVVAGPDVAPVVLDLDADEARSGVVVRLGDPVRPVGGRWVSGDTHVHFLAPSTALLQARAEDVNVVHLLATQWGDHHTSIPDLGADLVSPDGAHAVWVGSENRQNLLGHVGLVGASCPDAALRQRRSPRRSAGRASHASDGRLAAALPGLGGLAIGAHFPLPMAEIAADIDAGLLDALEMQCFDDTLESPPIREWYRYLDAGYRLPIVGGTDKMTATVPLGQIRTWARLRDDDALTFDSWATAVRQGRTFVTSGPLIELSIDGHGPGDTIEVSGSATLEVELTARAAQDVVSDLELVVDGTVVASESADPPARDLALRHRVHVQGGADRGAQPEPLRDRLGVRDRDGRPHLTGLPVRARTPGTPT